MFEILSPILIYRIWNHTMPNKRSDPKNDQMKRLWEILEGIRIFSIFINNALPISFNVKSFRYIYSSNVSDHAGMSFVYISWTMAVYQCLFVAESEGA